MAADPRHTPPTDPRHWNPEVPEWPSYRPHRPRAGWDDRRLMINLCKVLAGIVLTLGVLFAIAFVAAGGWHPDPTFWRIEPVAPVAGDADP